MKVGIYLALAHKIHASLVPEIWILASQRTSGHLPRPATFVGRSHGMDDNNNDDAASERIPSIEHQIVERHQGLQL